ncbi:hypothetical protein H257_10061 [Aphanomyces astaci]|uniref:F-box/LRR-repeat protein 15-like leucin rich repeat domain-containing protein n=1 Tax=Aphanomyces astaci TaxID=112090 RepID=W4G9F0_APHAT|nr:hypothetical protein H257_10061 [Aphanomyces astaci]ETV75669.1 hypothetical protein H257_10061 [Aphanomyces astaci]|eukprot:XP_009834800.1 hypothetical protein H257_10061 [Aphanomyces astaci]
MLLLRERCVVTLSAMLVVELEGLGNVDAVDHQPLCRSVSLLPTHLKFELLALVIKHPQCSPAIFASVLSNDMDNISLKGLEAPATSLLPAWTRQKMGTHLTDLDLASLNQLTSSDLFTLLHNVPQLQVLNVSYITAWHDGHTVHIIRQAPHLRELQLEWCQHVTDVSVTHIANARNLRLECLGLTGTAMSSAGVVKLSCCEHLRELTLQACDRVDALPSPLPNLQVLDIRGLSYIADADLFAFLKLVWTNMRKVNLGESNLSIASLTALQAQGTCPVLHCLDLSWCFHLTNNVVAACFPLTPLLHTIKLRCVDIDDTCLDAIGAHCPRLVKLNVARCRAVSDKGLASIFANCPALQHVDVAWTLVSNAAVLDMLHLCPELRSLSVQGCKNINRELVHGIAKMPTSLPHFAYLDLSWVDDVMTTDIAAAVSAHPLLTIKGYFGDLYDDSDKYHEH